MEKQTAAGDRLTQTDTDDSLAFGRSENLVLTRQMFYSCAAAYSIFFVLSKIFHYI